MSVGFSKILKRFVRQLIIDAVILIQRGKADIKQLEREDMERESLGIQSKGSHKTQSLQCSKFSFQLLV